MKVSTHKDIPQNSEAENCKTTTSPKVRAAVYCRGDDTPDYGCQAQLLRLTEKINSNPDWDMAGVYRDVDGRSEPAFRPAFRHLLDDCHSGKIDKILVLSLSRLARRITECQEILRELDVLGVSVRFEKEDIDTADIEGGRLLDIMLNCMAQSESEQIPMGICTSKFTRIMPTGRKTKGARNNDGNKAKSHYHPRKS